MAARRWPCCSAAASTMRSACTAWAWRWARPSGSTPGTSIGLQRLVQRIEPVRVSDHACFARAPLHGGQPPVHGTDLLPIAFTDARARHHGAQRAAGAGAAAPADRWWRTCRPTCAGPTMRSTRPQFFNELARRSGCGMLLDVNNLVVNAHQPSAPIRWPAACRFVDAIDPRHRRRDPSGRLQRAGARHRDRRSRQPRA